MKYNITSIKQTLVIAVALVLTLPQFANAAWYWVSVPTAPQTGYFIEVVSPNTIGYTGTGLGSYGDRTITPDGFMDVMDDTKDSNKCSGQLNSAISQLRNFDSSYVVLVQPTEKCRGDCGPYYSPSSVAEREALLLSLKSSAEQCLVKEALAIQQAEEERRKKEAEEKRVKEVEKAVAICDLDFFNNKMTDKERMDTWEQRQVCKAQDTADVVSEPVMDSVSPTTQVIQPFSQTPSITPSYSLPVTKSDNNNIESEQKEEITATSSALSETSDQGVPQVEDVEVAATEEPQTITFFQKIIQFFTGWFK